MQKIAACVAPTDNVAYITWSMWSSLSIQHLDDHTTVVHFKRSIQSFTTITWFIHAQILEIQVNSWYSIVSKKERSVSVEFLLDQNWGCISVSKPVDFDRLGSVFSWVYSTEQVYESTDIEMNFVVRTWLCNLHAYMQSSKFGPRWSFQRCWYRHEFRFYVSPFFLGRKCL